MANDHASSSLSAQAASDPPNTTPINQYINISNYMSYAQSVSYADTGLESAIGLEPLMANGQIVEVLNQKTGVFAEAFITTGNVPASQKQIVIGYEGADPYAYGNAFTGGQINSVGAIFAGKTAAGASTATAFARQVMAIAQNQYGLGSASISVTGQNLGGAFAQYAAVKTGLGGATFAAPGIKLTGAEQPSTLQNYIAGGDPVGNYTSSGALGPLVVSAQIRHYGTETLYDGQMFQSVLQGLANQGYNSHDFVTVADRIGFAEKFLTSASGSLASSLQNYAANLNSNGQTVNLVPITPSSTAADPNQTGISAALPISDSGLVPTIASGLPSTSDRAVNPTASNGLNTTMVNRYINLSNYMYQAKILAYGKTTLRANLDLKPLRVNGQIVRVVSNETGVTGEAFVSTGAGPKQIIVAYEGTAPYAAGSTNDFTGAQLYDDTSLFAGQVPIGARVATKFAERVEAIAERRFGDKGVVTLTGHSLGASEAQYAAAATGLGGATFGGTGIVTNASGKGLTNFVNGGDPVGNYAFDSGNPEGGFITSDQINHYGGAALIGDPAARQGLENVSTQFEQDGNVSAAISALGAGNYVDYHHLTDTIVGTTVISGYASSLNQAGYSVNLIDLPCYRQGTAIRTPQGDRSIETLCAGDLVVTAAGVSRAVKWVGNRTLDCRRHPRAEEVWPVRIAAHALGDNRPSRDLYVSPNHAICVDVAGEVLVLARSLVNGMTIVQDRVETVTYWHLELDTHDILLAENQPAESYLDMANRGFFQHDRVVGLFATPDAPVRSHDDFCRPFVDTGPILDAIRARLARRTGGLKYVSGKSAAAG